MGFIERTYDFEFNIYIYPVNPVSVFWKNNSLLLHTNSSEEKNYFIFLVLDLSYRKSNQV